MHADLSLLTGSWLLTYLLHSSLLLVGVWFLARRPRIPPAVRDSLWKAGLVGAILTSTLQFGLGFEPLGGRLALSQPARSAAPAPDPVWGGQLLQSPAPLRRMDPTPASSASPTAAREAPLAAEPAASMPAAAVESSASAFERYLPSLVWVWAAVGGFLLLLYLVRRARAMREIGPRRPVGDPALLAMLESLRHAGGVRRPIRLTCAPGIGSPVALGASEIVLPEAALTELDREQQQSMLAHELAHLARRDPTWLALACVIERVFFLQPLNRLARARMQETAELLCDDWAVHRTGSGFSLATCLVKVAEWVDTTPRPVPLAGMAEHRSQLVTRIHRLIEGRTMPTAPRSLWLVAGAAVLLGVTAVAAPGVTPVRSDTSADPDPAVAESAPGDETLMEAAAADTDTVIATPRSSWDRAASRLRAMEYRLAGKSRTSRASMDALRAELKAATLAAPAVGWAGPTPAPSPAPRLPGMGWRGERQRDTTGIAVPALIAALKDPDVRVRRAAANSLSNFDDPRAVPGLIEALKDSDEEVRACAANALGSLEDKRAVPGLVALLKDGNREVRQAALNALHSMSADVPDDAILTAMNDADPEVRQAAIGLALHRMEDQDEDTPADPRYVAAFTRLLGDASADTRQRAVEALGSCRIKEAPAGLLAAARDKNADVRQSVANALGSIGDPKAVPALKELLGDGNADVRESAVQALGSIRDRAALEALVGALKSSDPAVRRSAAEALGQRGD